MVYKLHERKAKSLSELFGFPSPGINTIKLPLLNITGRTWIVGKGGLWVRRIVGKADCTHEHHLLISTKHCVVS